LPSEQLIDPRRQGGQRLRRFLLQVGVPVGGVLLVVLTIAGVSWRSYEVSRAGALRLSGDLLEVQRDYVTQKVKDYLDPAASGAAINAQTLSKVPAEIVDAVFRAHAESMLAQVPQIDSFYLADEDGHISMIRHGTAPRSIAISTFVTTPTSRTFSVVTYDPSGKVQKTDTIDAGTFDVRAQPWFQGAMSHDGIFWSQPYVFANTHNLMVTTAQSYVGSDGRKHVFAVNILLNNLSQFLETIKIGKSGHALVLDAQGHLLAGRIMTEVANEAGWDPKKMVPSPVKHPMLSRAWDQYRVEGYGTRLVSRKDTTYIAVTTALGKPGDDWVLMLVANEADFASFARASGRQSFIFSLVIVALTIVLAGFLVRQGRLTERVNRKLTAARALAEEERNALGKIAAAPGLFDLAEEPLVLSEVLARVTHAQRASLWRLRDGGNRLVCEDSFDLTQDAHSGGFEYSRVEMEAFFNAILEGGAFDVARASADPRTQAFHRVFMHANETEAVHIHPFRGSDNSHGLVVLEEAGRAAVAAPFIDLIASIAAVRFALRQDEARPQASGTPDPVSASGAPLLQFGDAFLIPPREDAELREGLFPAVAVMVISFVNPPISEPRESAAVIEVVGRLAQRVQEIARECGLFSVKVVGHRLVCVAGCSETIDEGAPARMLDAALKVREAALVMLSEADIDPIFRVGVDVGPVLGSYLGSEPPVFNVWGRTMAIAERMAQGASDYGTIQVTEAVFSVLRDRYLFRTRGAFFAPGTGVGRTYTLVGQR